MEPGYAAGKPPEDYDQTRTWRLQRFLDNCCRPVLPYHAVKLATDGTEQLNNPPQVGAENTTTSNYPSNPSQGYHYTYQVIILYGR